MRVAALMKLTLLILTLTLTALLANQYPSMLVQVPDVVLEPGEELRIEYEGAASVLTVLPVPGEGVSIEHGEALADGAFKGIIILRLENRSLTSAEPYRCVVALSSTERFTVSVFTVGLGVPREDLMPKLECPASVTVQLGLSLSSKPLLKEVGYAPLTPILGLATTWELLAYVLTLPFFGAAWFMDVKDLKAKRRRIAKQESLALMLRYLFYGFLLASILTVLGVVGYSIYSFATGRGFVLGLLDLALPAFLLLPVAVTYGVGRWRGWYDVIDEGD